MTMPTPCQVLGNIITIGLEPAAGVSIRFLPEPDVVARASDAVVVPKPLTVVVPSSGEIDVDLVPGRYAVVAGQGTTSYKRFLITVPAASLAYLAQIIDAAPPATLDAAQQAVLDAQTARDAANASAAASATSATNSNTAKTAAQAAQTASEAARDASVTAKTASQAAQAAAETAKAGAEAARDAAAASQGAAAGSASAAAGSALGAAGSASTATAQASTATTKADEAAASAAAAANSATAADGSAGAAATQAVIAATEAGQAYTSASIAAASEAAAAASASGAATSEANINTSYGAMGTLVTKADEAAISAGQAQASASLAQGYAASASSVVQQDLSGVTAQALHRSPNAITALAIYDTSKDSDGGAWTKKCQHTSWYNETLYGKWLGAVGSEHDARAVGATLGSELISNGTFTTDTTGWTAKTPETVLSVVGGRLRVASTGAAAYGKAEIAITTVVGKTYVLRMDAFAVGSSAPFVYVGSTSGGSNLLTHYPVSRPVVTFTAITTTTYITLYSNSATGVLSSDYDNVSVKEVTAFNAASGDYFQLSTDGKFYRLWKNLFRASEQFDDANWTKTNSTITANAGTTPDGLNNAYLWTENTVSGSHGIYQIVTGWTAATRVFTVHFDLKNAGRRYISIGDTSNAAWNVGVDLQTGTIISSGGASGSTTSATITPLGNDWHRVSLTFTEIAPPATTNNIRVVAITGRATSGRGSENYPGDGVSGFYIRRGQLEAGAAVTDYEFKLPSDSFITEVFRGNKREFPKLAAIVAEAANVTIYDLTEPGRPMWMRFASGSISGAANSFMSGTASYTKNTVSTVNGELIIGQTATAGFGLVRVIFPADTAYAYSNVSTYGGAFNGNISQRNTSSGYPWSGFAFPIIASTTVNAVAMAVLPDAPIDAATGLRVPTIAVATSSGLSVIRHDGSVANPTNIGANNVSFDARNNIVYGIGENGRNYRKSAPPYTAVTTYIGGVFAFNGTVNTLLSGSMSRHTGKSVAVTRNAAGNGAVLIRDNDAANVKALGSVISGNFNTGWMAGDIRRCYLSDVTAEGISSPELITNGSFASDVSGWTAPADGSSITWSSGAALISSNGSHVAAYQAITVVPGKQYVVSGIATTGSTNCRIRAGTAPAGSNFLNAVLAQGPFRLVITPTVSSLFINLGTNAATGTATFDNISVTEFVADRSYKAAAASIAGALTKSELASGTSLMGYSGWSASNYASEPYSADLDFGTGEWTMSAWLRTAVAPRRNLATYTEFPNGVTDAPVRTNVTSVSGVDFGFATTSGIAFSANAVDAYAYKSITLAASTTYMASVYVKMDDGNPPSFGSSTNTSPTNDFVIVFGGSGVNMTTASIVAVGGGTYRVSGVGTTAASPSTNAGVVKYGLNSNRSFKITGFQIEIGSNLTSYQKVIDGTEIWSAIAERAHSSGPSISFRMAGFGTIQAVVSDGTTSRTVTSSATYANNLWLKARVSYTTDGSLTLTINGREVARTTGTPLLTLNNSNAVLTIGNSRALDAPFTGSLALLKMSATVPASEQAQFMYAQEAQLFRAGAQSVLPDTSAIVDMSYDDATDRWVAVSASNESYWTGLVRNSVTAVPAGSYSKIAAGSGVELVARATTNPGVDVTIPAYGLREELVRRAEAAARLGKEQVALDYTGGFTGNTTSGSTAIASVAGLSYPTSYIGAQISGTGIPTGATIVAVSDTTIYISAAATATGTGVSISFLDFRLPAGLEAKEVVSAGLVKQEGSTKDYTRLYDSFTETIRFAVAPGATAWVQIKAQRITLQ